METVADLVLDDWYIARDPQIAALALPPFLHYCQKGWREGRAPNPHFDPALYTAACGADAPSGDPLLDYVRRGEAAGQAPATFFDPRWYRQTYQVPPEENALAHFLRRRFNGEVNPSRHFDTKFYLKTYHDVRNAHCDPLEHYRTRGQQEFRLPRPEQELIQESKLFQEDFYLRFYEDVRNAGVDPLDHFLHSTHELRKPNPYFDPGWYRDRYGAGYEYSPLTHYLLVGEDQGYSPSRHFEPTWYRQNYALPPGANALAHYLCHRKSQRFAPNRHFDVLKYVKNPQHNLLPERDPFFHFLVTRSQNTQGRRG